MSDVEDFDAPDPIAKRSKKNYLAPWNPFFVRGEPATPDDFVWFPDAVCPKCGHRGMWLELVPTWQVFMIRGRGIVGPFSPEFQCERGFTRTNADRCWGTHARWRDVFFGPALGQGSLFT